MVKSSIIQQILIGASFVNLGTDDGKEFQFGYNGEVRVFGESCCQRK